MSHRRKTIKVRPTRTLDRVEGRVNLVWFCSLGEVEQDKIFKSCIDKSKLKNLQEVAQKLVAKYDTENVTLNYYLCPHCLGYHTTGADSHRRNLIRRMIIKWKRKNNKPTSRRLAHGTKN